MESRQRRVQENRVSTSLPPGHISSNKGSFFRRPIHGLIFLFKWVQDDEPAGPVVQDSRLDHIFFAKQVINNACATQAILSLLLNCKHADLQLGSTLTDLQEFCQTFDPYTKGLTLSNAAQIRTVHNSFARQTLFEIDNKVGVPELFCLPLLTTYHLFIGLSSIYICVFFHARTFA